MDAEKPFGKFTVADMTSLSNMVDRYHLSGVLEALWIVAALKAEDLSLPRNSPTALRWREDSEILGLISKFMLDRPSPPPRLFLLY